jgi:hypothetical protein
MVERGSALERWRSRGQAVGLNPIAGSVVSSDHPATEETGRLIMPLSSDGYGQKWASFKLAATDDFQISAPESPYDGLELFPSHDQPPFI